MTRQARAVLRTAHIGLALAAFVATLFGCASVRTAEDRALAVLHDYSHSYLKQDWQRIIALTHPRVLSATGGEAALISELKSVEERAGWPTDELFVRALRCSLGNDRLVMVRSQRKFEPLQGERFLPHNYIVHSRDSGLHWFVVDMGCTSIDTVIRLLPRWDGASCGGADVAKFLDAES